MTAKERPPSASNEPSVSAGPVCGSSLTESLSFTSLPVDGIVPSDSDEVPFSDPTWQRNAAKYHLLNTNVLFSFL